MRGVEIENGVLNDEGNIKNDTKDKRKSIISKLKLVFQ